MTSLFRLMALGLLLTTSSLMATSTTSYDFSNATSSSSIISRKFIKNTTSDVAFIELWYQQTVSLSEKYSL